MSHSKTRLFNIALVLGLLVTSMLWTTSSKAKVLNSITVDLQSGKLVVVARDMTKNSDCTFQVNGVEISCIPGMVVGDYFVSREEAISNGEEFVIPTGNYATDQSAVQRLMGNVSRRTLEQNKNALDKLAAITSCGIRSGGGSFTASNFSSPQPKIGYSISYYVSGSSCNVVNVTSSNTYFVQSGSNAYLEFTSFNNIPGDPSGGWYPGCPTNIPHQSNYSTPMTGFTGNYFTDQVESGCGIFDHHAYGYTPLN